MKKSLIGLKLLNKFYANKMQHIEKRIKRNILLLLYIITSSIIPLISGNNEYYLLLYILLIVIFFISMTIYEIIKWKKEKVIYKRIMKVVRDWD